MDIAGTMTIDSQRGLVRLSFEGPFELAHAQELLRAMLAHPDFQPGYPGLWDVRHAEVSAWDKDVMSRLSAFNRGVEGQRGEARIGILVSPGLAYGLGRMLEALHDAAHLQVRVFTDEAEAERWLRSQP